MKKIRVYNDEEIKILLSNINVESIKNKSQIVYRGEFKLWAVKEKLSHSEKTAREIFESGGFDMKILDDRTPQKRLNSWIKKYQKFGEDYFINKNKYSYQAKTLKNNSIDPKDDFSQYIRKVVSNPRFVALIVEKDENGRIRINNLVSTEDEKINN